MGIDIWVIRTSNGVQRQRRKQTATQDGDKRDDTRIRVAAVMIRIREQHRTTLLFCDLARDAEQPLLRYNADGCEPRRVHVQSVRMVVRVCELANRWDVVRGFRDVNQRRLQRARRHRRGGFRQH